MLINMIESLRKELDEAIGKSDLCYNEILTISRKLDNLILEFMKTDC